MTQRAAPAAATATDRLVLDWHTIWRSELQALAADGEAHDMLEHAVRLMHAGWTAFDSGASPAAGTDAPARPASVAAASDARDAAIRQLEQRVAELERLLAGSRGER